jgi:trehalose/maltose transport system substrate-binding protein
LICFYRKDLLEKYGIDVPTTWEDLTKAAYKIQEGERKAGNPDFVGFVWQGNAYEGLTCDALEWIHSFGGGRIISEDKKVTLNNPKAIAAIKMAANWVGTISPRGVTGMNEDKSMLPFVGGNAAFLRSWPYIYGLTEAKGCAVKGKVGVIPIPSKYPELRSGIAGFESLAVNKYSKHPDAAVKVLKYFTSEKGQKIRAMVGGLCPTVESLYNDKEVMTKNPTFAIFLKIFENTFSAPKAEAGKKYNEVSIVFYRAVHNVLLGKNNAESAMMSAADQISKITGFPQGQPAPVAGSSADLKTQPAVQVPVS